ncbi:MAG: hypothetical protein C4519_11555 [Desulfobacteraceae bacterium]|nr:MAG: hypothetical protein C4519_11555 [Desulfobacteraceae bacterium]
MARDSQIAAWKHAEEIGCSARCVLLRFFYRPQAALYCVHFAATRYESHPNTEIKNIYKKKITWKGGWKGSLEIDQLAKSRSI